MMLTAIRSRSSARLPMLFALALLAAFPAVWSSPTASAAPVPLRAVDWAHALLNHPQLYAVPPEGLPA